MLFVQYTDPNTSNTYLILNGVINASTEQFSTEDGNFLRFVQDEKGNVEILNAKFSHLRDADKVPYKIPMEEFNKGMTLVHLVKLLGEQVENRHGKVHWPSNSKIRELIRSKAIRIEPWPEEETINESYIINKDCLWGANLLSIHMKRNAWLIQFVY